MNINNTIPLTVSGLAGSLAVLILTYVISRTVYNLYLHPLAGYPGPKIAAVSEIWYSYYWTSGRWPFVLRELHELYGDVVRIAPNELSFTSVDSYRDIYGHASKSRKPCEKGPFYDRGVQYPSIIAAKGQEHRHQRKALAHAFSAKALREQEDIIQQYIGNFTDQLGNWSSRPNGVNIVEALNWVAFDIIGKLAFGESFGAVEAGKTHPWISVLLDSIRETDLINLRKRVPIMNLILPFLIPKGLGAKFEEHWQHTIDMTKRRIAKKDTIVRTDFFQHILEHGIMEEEQLQQNAETLIIAGSETTSTTLASCLYYLMRHEDCLASLQKEVRDTFHTLAEITGDSAQGLPYLHACIEEALRMYPPVPFGLERVSHGTTIDGNWVPAGTLVSTQAWSIKRDVRYWQDPDSFKPERWLGEGLGDNKDAFQPFSLGPRACIGINLAYLEMHVSLARMVMQYDFELLSKDLDWTKDSKMYVLWRKPTMNMKFHLREGVPN